MAGEELQFEDIFDHRPRHGRDFETEEDDVHGEGEDESALEAAGVLEPSSPYPVTEREVDVTEELARSLGNGEASGIPIVVSSNINLSNFTFLSCVGKGGFGKVHQVRKVDTGEIFALKALKKNFLVHSHAVEYTRSERDILRKVRHPFIVGLHYAFQNEHKVYLVMDFVNGGQLLYHLRKEAMFSEEMTKFYTAELVLALEHLHSLDIVHRDLKPENVLLDSEGHCVLTDFGFAKENVRDQSHTSFCGTMEYMAPEMISGAGYGKSADWWSLGILIYDMLTGNPPFRSGSDSRLQEKILNDKIRFPDYMTSDAKSLLRGLINKDAARRLGTERGASAIKTHPWFRSVNWKKIITRQLPPPFVPNVINGKLDLSNFDSEYTQLPATDSPATPLPHAMQDAFKGFSFVRSPMFPDAPLRQQL